MRSSLAFYLFLSPESVFRGWPSTSPLSSQPSPDRSPHKNFPIRSTRTATALRWSCLRWETDQNPSSFLSPSNATLYSNCELIIHAVSFGLCCYNRSFFYCVMLAFFWYKSGEGSSATSSMSVSMKDLDPAFRGAGQKEYPFSLASLNHMISSCLTISTHWNTFSDHSIILY